MTVVHDEDHFGKIVSIGCTTTTTKTTTDGCTSCNVQEIFFYPTGMCVLQVVCEQWNIWNNAEEHEKF